MVPEYVPSFGAAVKSSGVGALPSVGRKNSKDNADQIADAWGARAFGPIAGLQEETHTHTQVE